MRRACRPHMAEEDSVVSDLHRVEELAIEVGERAGDNRARAVPVARFRERLQELGRAARRAVAGDVALVGRQDADPEASPSH